MIKRNIYIRIKAYNRNVTTMREKSSTKNLEKPKEYTTIQISKKMHNWLVGKGRKSESFDNILNRLLSAR